MNEDLYGLQASGIAPEIAAKLIPLQRQQAVAEAMLKNSMSPINVPQGTKMHPLQGLAKIVEAYMAQKSLSDADKQRQELTNQNAEMAKSAMSDYEAKRNGIPGITPLTPNDDEGNPMPSRAEVKGDPRAAVAMAVANPLLAKNPLIAADIAAMRQEDRPYVLGRTLVDKSGKVLATDETWAQEQEATRLARLDQAKAAAEEKAAREAAALQGRKDLVALAASLRGPTAPTMSEVLDPKDPTRMLRVDAKSYKGGTLGDVGVLGVSGKEPTAAKREEQVGQGRETVSSIVSELRGKYEELAKNSGIVDPKAGWMSNLSAGAASSGVGQAVGNVFGTENQSARNTIAQTRPLLLNAIKQATGMSAKQMDSNAELKMYLAAATDPKLDIKANLAALDNLDKLYGLGLGASPTNVSTGKIGQSGGLSPQEQKELDALRIRFGRK